MSNARNLANLLNTDTTIATADVANGGITTAKLADDAVTSAKLDTNIAIGGTLGVTGATTLTGALTVNDPIQILNGSNVNSASTDADDLIIEGPNDCGLSILSATTGRLFFGDASDNDVGSIRYIHTDNSMRFETNAGERMRIDSSGNLGLGATTVDTDIHIEKSSDIAIKLERTNSGVSTISVPSSGFLNILNTSNAGLTLGTNNTERMRIASDGNVFIGATSGSNKLEVDGGSAQTRLRVSTTGTDLREAGIILANSSKSSNNDGIVISHGGAVTTFDDLGGNELMRLGQSSNRPRLALGTSSPDGLLTIRGDENPLIRVNHTQNADEIMMIMQHAGAIASGFTTMIQFRDHDGDERGTIKTNGSSTQFNTSSDYRLKENVTYDFDATSRLKQLKPARFNFIGIADNTVDGFLAHEVSSIVPEAISGEKDAMTKEVLYVDGDEIPDGKKVGDIKEAKKIAPQGIDQSKLVPLLTKTILELEARITVLESA